MKLSLVSYITAILPLVAEKYKVAIQYRFIKVAWQHWQKVYELLNVISDLCVRVVCVNEDRTVIKLNGFNILTLSPLTHTVVFSMFTLY